MSKRRTKQSQYRKLNRILDKHVKNHREHATPAEERFANILSANGIRYFFQHPFQDGTKIYTIDFYLPDYLTAVEIDGTFHKSEEALEEDEVRTKNILKKHDRYRQVIRFDNGEVLPMKDQGKEAATKPPRNPLRARVRGNTELQ